MSAQPNAQQSGGSCLLTALIMLSICLALLVGAAGGVMLDSPQLQQQAPDFPSIPAPAPETLNIVPSVQTFAEPLNDCPDPSQPWAGWEDGVGGVLPPCWTREQQNAYMRSH